MSDRPTVVVDSMRLTTCRSMIAKMCSERRPPCMSIPADKERDEDLFIIDTLISSDAELTRLRARVAAMEGFVEKVFQHWSFDNDQRHTHTWHTREDLREEWSGIKTDASRRAEKENTNAGNA